MGRGVFLSGTVVQNENYMFTMGRSALESAAEIIEKLKARLRDETDTDLAVCLLISRSSVANWLNRDSIPDRYRKIADGQVNWAAYARPDGEMFDVERAAMRIAIMRLIRDFGDVATDYRAFLERSMEAAASWQKYEAQACKDLCNEMSAREEENAHYCADLLVYREEFDAKYVSLIVSLAVAKSCKINSLEIQPRVTDYFGTRQAQPLAIKR